MGSYYYTKNTHQPPLMSNQTESLAISASTSLVLGRYQFSFSATSRRPLVGLRQIGYWTARNISISPSESPKANEFSCWWPCVRCLIASSFSWRDAFCDETGTVIQDFPRSIWTNSFSRYEENCLVTNFIQYLELADLEKILEMGFKEGYTEGLNNLDEFLKG